MKIVKVNWDDPEAEEMVAALKREEARGTLEVAGDNDRAWFEANPTRRYRLRAPLAGEHFHFKGDMTRASATVVRLAASGWRLKVHITLAQALATYLDDEITAKTIWKGLERRHPELSKLRKHWK